MDSLEFNKLLAAGLVALIIIKAADLASKAFIPLTTTTVSAYKIEGVVDNGAILQPSQSEQVQPIETLLATANAKNGEAIFKKCTSCHTIEKGAPHRIGPNLYGIIGAKKAHEADFSYSSSMKSKGGTWTYEDLNHFLFKPREFVPGTKMSFAGLKDAKERTDLILYLRQQNDVPPALPK